MPATTTDSDLNLVETSKTETITKSSAENPYNPKEIAKKVEARLTEIAESESDASKKAWYQSVIKRLQGHLDEFDPNHENNKIDAEAFEKLKESDPEKWRVLYNSFSTGIRDFMGVAEKLMDSAESTAEQYLLFKYVEIAAGGEVKPEKAKQRLEEYGIATGPQAEEVVQVLNTVKTARLVPFNKYVEGTDTKPSTEVLEDLEKSAHERRAALGAVVNLYERVSHASDKKEAFTDTATLQTETKITITKEESLNAGELLVRLQKQWELETAKSGIEILDTTMGNKIVDRDWYGKDKEHRTNQFNTTMQKVVRVPGSDGKERLVKVEVPVVTFYADIRLSALTNTPVGDAKWKDPTMHMPIFDSDFNSIDKIGLMRDMANIPPSVKNPDGSIKIPVMNGEKANWLVLDAQQHEQLVNNLDRGMKSFEEKTPFRYDREAALRKLVKPNSKKVEETTTESYLGGGFKTADHGPLDWIDYRKAGTTVSEYLNEVKNNLGENDPRKPNIEVTILGVEKLYTDFTASYGRTDAYLNIARQTLKNMGISEKDADYADLLEIEFKRIFLQFSQNAKALRTAYEEMRARIPALRPGELSADQDTLLKEDMVREIIQIAATLESQVIELIPAKRSPEDENKTAEQLRTERQEREMVETFRSLLDGSSPHGNTFRAFTATADLKNKVIDVGEVENISNSIAITVLSKVNGIVDKTKPVSIDTYTGADYYLQDNETLVVVTEINSEGNLKQAVIEIPTVIAEETTAKLQNAINQGDPGFPFRVIEKAAA